jgi:hypothetical protein
MGDAAFRIATRYAGNYYRIAEPQTGRPITAVLFLRQVARYRVSRSDVRAV